MQNSQAASPSRDSYYQILIGQSKLWVGSCQDFVVPCDCQFWTLFADWMMFIVFCCFLPFHWQAASTDKHSISQAPAFGDLRLPSGIDVAEFAWLVLAGHLQKPKHSKQHLVYRASIIEYPNVSHWNIFKQIQTRKKMIKFAWPIKMTERNGGYGGFLYLPITPQRRRFKRPPQHQTSETPLCAWSSSLWQRVALTLE